jgi:trehalose 6-phosphate synthase
VGDGGDAPRVVFVSNRLPIVAEHEAMGWTARASSGGLVTALKPLLKRSRGMWIGWAGTAALDGAELDTLMQALSKENGYQMAGIPLTPADYDFFYQGFCNEIIWPLFHDFQSLCDFVPEYWTSALKVEQAFAAVVLRHARPRDLVWVQDYHLMGVGKALRKGGLRNRLAFFLHIPFPPPDIYCKLPWRVDVLEGLLHYDVIGLQTHHDLKNFCDCVHTLLPDSERERMHPEACFELNGHPSVAGAFPIGIDFDEFSDGAASPEVEQKATELRRLYQGQQIILSVDRLDYTKGIPYRLRAFARALERYPDLHKNVTLVQIVVPSRETVTEYQHLRDDIERMVAHVNGRFSQPGWVPIHHLFRNFDRTELLAWYRAADVGLVTPLKDGMNLVCKEYCASQLDMNGVLMLSEFAGASEQMGESALVVNPYDIDSVAAAIPLATLMTPGERRAAMEKLRASVKAYDVYWWLGRFLQVCGFDASALASDAGFSQETQS